MIHNMRPFPLPCQEDLKARLTIPRPTIKKRIHPWVKLSSWRPKSTDCAQLWSDWVILQMGWKERTTVLDDL